MVVAFEDWPNRWDGLKIVENEFIVKSDWRGRPIGSTRRQVLELSARTAVIALASMLAARLLRLPQNLLGVDPKPGSHAVIAWFNSRSSW
jgi:hypothetical protein